MTKQPQAGERWLQMQDAIKRAQQRPVAVIEAVASSASREEAATTLANLLELDDELAVQLLDLHLADFVGQIKPA